MRPTGSDCRHEGAYAVRSKQGDRNSRLVAAEQSIGGGPTASPRNGRVGLESLNEIEIWGFKPQITRSIRRGLDLAQRSLTGRVPGRARAGAYGSHSNWAACAERTRLIRETSRVLPAR
jgi:hypothetical protein